MKKILIMSVIALALVGGIFTIARSPAGGDPAPAVAGARAPQPLSVIGSPYDFGPVSMARGKVSYDFRVTNSGTEPVTIRKMYTSCMCTVARLTTREGTIGPVGMPGHGFVPNIDRVIAPGETAVVTATFDPAAHGPAGIGRIDRTVILERDAGLPVELAFSATVTP